MNGGKGEKTIGPMFPRIHLNDTDKGGPRAPPRNKMALYEQFSVPSRRVSHLSSNSNSVQGNVSGRGPFDPENKPDQEDFSVPIFTHNVLDYNQEKPPASYPTHDQHLLEQIYKDTGTPKHSTAREGESKNGNIIVNISPLDDIASHHLPNGTGQKENLERGDSVSEDSVLDVVCEVDLTPDDVVGVIGQKHFWKSRQAIINQQRVFAVQVFELHRLIKVQRSIAAAPDILIKDSTYFSKPEKSSPPKKRPLEKNTCESTPNDPKRKAKPEKPARKNECSAENTLDNTSSSHSSRNGPLTNGSHSFNQPCFSQLLGHHWLIPVMSPYEGLVYKPFPGPGITGQPCGPPSPNPTMSNFLGPTYGIHPPHSQYLFPSFPPFGYFQQYGVPVMNVGPGLHFQAHVPVGGPDFSVQPMAGQTNGPASGSMESSPGDKLVAEGPGNCASNSGSQDFGPEGPNRVIKVIPRNGLSASVHAARIFMTIQEERGRFDVV